MFYLTDIRRKWVFIVGLDRLLLLYLFFNCVSELCFWIVFYECNLQITVLRITVNWINNINNMSSTGPLKGQTPLRCHDNRIRNIQLLQSCRVGPKVWNQDLALQLTSYKLEITHPGNCSCRRARLTSVVWLRVV